MEISKLEPEEKRGLVVVLTGRDAHQEVVERADTVRLLSEQIPSSEVNEIKHAYRKDIEPQPGIDY